MASIFSQSVRDNIYIAFFLVHLAASVVLDTQLLFPNYKEWFPNFATQLSEYYAQSSNDPTIRDGILQPWFRSYVWCELLVQVPVFIVGSLGLWKGDRRVWPLVLAYGAHAATTVLACLAEIQADKQLDSQQYTMLMSSFVPFFTVPLVMCIDMTYRVTGILAATQSHKVKET